LKVSIRSTYVVIYVYNADLYRFCGTEILRSQEVGLKTITLAANSLRCPYSSLDSNTVRACPYFMHFLPEGSDKRLTLTNWGVQWVLVSWVHASVAYASVVDLPCWR